MHSDIKIQTEKLEIKSIFHIWSIFLYLNTVILYIHDIKIQLMTLVSLIMKTIPLLMLILINLVTYILLRRKFKRCVQTARRRRRYNRTVISILTIVLSFVITHGLRTIVSILEIIKLLAGNVFFIRLCYFNIYISQFQNVTVLGHTFI